MATFGHADVGSGSGGKMDINLSLGGPRCARYANVMLHIHFKCSLCLFDVSVLIGPSVRSPCWQLLLKPLPASDIPVITSFASFSKSPP